MSENILFYLGDKLPTVYDAAIAIFSICRKVNSPKNKDTISNYTRALIAMWTRSFGEQHTLKKTAVNVKLETIVQDYYNNVYNNQTAKHIGEQYQQFSILVYDNVTKSG